MNVWILIKVYEYRTQEHCQVAMLVAMWCIGWEYFFLILNNNNSNSNSNNNNDKIIKELNKK